MHAPYQFFHFDTYMTVKARSSLEMPALIQKLRAASHSSLTVCEIVLHQQTVRPRGDPTILTSTAAAKRLYPCFTTCYSLSATRDICVTLSALRVYVSFTERKCRFLIQDIELSDPQQQQQQFLSQAISSVLDKSQPQSITAVVKQSPPIPG